MTLLQARVGGLGVLQTDAEVAASSSEKITSVQKKVEQSTVISGKSNDGNVGGLTPTSYMEKGCPPTPEINSAQALFEATRGKVGALKQVGSFEEGVSMNF